MDFTRSLLVPFAFFGALGACGEDEGGEDMVHPEPVDPRKLARFQQWQEDTAMPAVFLDAAAPAVPRAGGSRIGRPAWIPEGSQWPLDRTGAPMSFLAQLDFAELPKLEDYPESGVLQFFIARDIHFGANFAAPEKGDFKLVFLQDTAGEGELRPSRHDGRNGEDFYSPMDDESLRATGVELTGRPGLSRPEMLSWTLRRDLPDFVENNSFATLNAIVLSGAATLPERHHFGGHPGFTQDDWRVTERYREADRVLLELWSRDGLMWGDLGQGHFMIRREDLLKRDFDKAFYSWDSG